MTTRTGGGCGDAEEGATATMVVVAMFALLGIAMLAVDGGFLLASRRGQIADTDAAALAAARSMIDDACDEGTARAVAEDYLDRNHPDTSTVTFDVVYDGTRCSGGRFDSGYVQVVTQKPSTVIFGGIFGNDNPQATVRSEARFGQQERSFGVRPIGLCVDDPHYLEWRTYRNAVLDGDSSAVAAYEAKIGPARSGADPEHPNNLYPGATGLVHRLEIDKLSEATVCIDSDGDGPSNTAAGNWGWLDFNGGGGGMSEFRDSLLNGYAPGVGLGAADDFTDEDCDLATATLDSTCPPKPGAGGGAFKPQLDAITCPVDLAADDCPHQIDIVVYDVVDGTGKNAAFDLRSLVRLVIRGSSDKFTGNPAPGDYLDFEFIIDIVSGGVAGFDPDSSAALGVSFCGVNQLSTCPLP